MVSRHGLARVCERARTCARVCSDMFGLSISLKLFPPVSAVLGKLACWAMS